MPAVEPVVGQRGVAGVTPPGARASRPQPYSWLDVTWRQRDVTGSHQPVGVNRNGKARGDPRRRCRSNRVAEMPEAVPDMVRAGRPRSRVGILFTTNRNHGLHPAQESGKAPRSALDNHSPLEGESARPGRMPAVEPVGANAASRE